MAYTTVHLLRHGEVDNPEGILYGRLKGFGLTPLGKEMANTVADFLVDQGADITAVIASPLLRAQQTAAPTARAYGLAVEADPRLIEAGNEFEGMQVNKNRWALAHPRYWPRYRDPFLPSWGEPYAQISQRMAAAIAAAAQQARGHEALLVSHQLPIVTVQRFLEGKALAHNPLWRQCSLASLTSVTFDGDQLVGWNYTEPAIGLLVEAADMNPGASGAGTRR